MSATVWILTYCVAILVVSLAGGFIPSLIKLTHVRMQLMMSLVSGLMLGVALLHMLPHSVEYLEDTEQAMMWVGGSILSGLLVMFFLLRIFFVHHHHHDHEDEHDHGDQGHDHAKESGSEKGWNWLGLFFGLAIHTLLDGVALAASVVAESHGDDTGAFIGLATFLAVFLHKPLDALSITSLMRAGGWSKASQSIVNIGFALMCPLGALLFWMGASQLPGHHWLIGCALGFSAGFFLCIALSDLLPEVAFHTHDRWKLSAALLLGVALAVIVETMHTHEHGPPADAAKQSAPEQGKNAIKKHKHPHP